MVGDALANFQATLGEFEGLNQVALFIVHQAEIGAGRGDVVVLFQFLAQLQRGSEPVDG